MTKQFEIMLNGKRQLIEENSVLNVLRSEEVDVPSLCYHPSLGAIETCDTCIVKVNGEFVRSCSTEIKPGDVVESVGSDVHEAQLIAMDRILGNHELYCTVCDFNNGNCEIHNAVKEMKITHQETEHTSKESVVQRNSFYRYDLTNAYYVVGA